jgi:glycosyltransferase involved in cell wall biosynthesis
MSATPGSPLKVVALLPAWNAEAFIVPVLETLAAQTYRNLEVLISDDASTDRTPEICAAFAARHTNFTLIRQRTNLGWIGNVNALLRHAQGDCFFFAFHDDLLLPSYVERLAGALASHPRAVLAFSDMIRRVVEPGTSLDVQTPSPPAPESVKVYLDLDGVHERVKRGVVVARKWGKPPSYAVMLANRGLFRASAAREIGGLRAHFAGEFGADWPWLLRLSMLGEFVRVPEALVEKSYRRTSLSATWRYSLWQRMGALTACMLETRKAGLPVAEELTIHGALLGYAAKRQWWALNKKWRVR